MGNARHKFQQLLRELFQFDLADLDFGIYRIMNLKRSLIERWIEEDLPKAIEEELQQGALAEMQRAQQALEEARQKVLDTLGEDALDAEGTLAAQYHNTKVGREYLEAQRKAAHAQPSEALEAAVYNHLYTFFSRYYQDGDFISRRRYARKEHYLVLRGGEPVEQDGKVLYDRIPYHGEEVTLYWANHDQYYVKTAEHFTDYTWKAPNGVTVHFKLQAADVEVNNVKGEKRFFLPVLDGIAWDAEKRTLTIPFHYRPLTEQEKITYGKSKQQEKIIAEALEQIPARLKGNAEALAALSAERRRDAKGNPVSYLAHHLRQYTARNTRDFFIHKDLRGFLSRELDFYLKNEVLNLDELEAAGENLAAGWFQLMRLIKRVGNHIIEFLAQIEDFQKALWEKKKFVTETFWCITVGNIPEDFYPEIAENEAQWEEWRALFHIHELPGDLKTKESRIAFLKAHPTLVLDTRHFSQDFTDRLLASFEDLDAATDGLLVHSENWQALNLLLEKYHERVKCIYIDPPYNTGNDEFLYHDNYQHSSWLAMMYDRLALGRESMRKDATIFVSIDDKEQARLEQMGSELFGRENRIATIIWHNSSRSSGKQISTVHEYIIAFSRRASALPEWKVPREDVQDIVIKVRSLWQKGRKEEAYKVLSAFIEQRLLDSVDDYSFLRNYSNIDEKGRVYYAVDLTGDGPGEARYFKDKGLWLDPPPGRHWMSQEYINELYEQQRIIWRGERPYRVVYLDEASENPQGIIRIPTRSGRHEQRRIFGVDVFEKPKPTALLVRLLKISMSASGIILDYFAGSGTTGHAVINLNREDGGRRKFILVEMGEYFDTVLLLRIKKVTFSPEWKDGKPKRVASQEEFERGPRVVKVVRLESYEDALNNIAFDEESGHKALDLFGDEYLLRYMLKWESRQSETFLDIEKLQAPFSYKLRIHRDGETREQAVDLPETFAYLIGLDVERRQVFYDGERRYLVHRGTTRDGRRVAVIWRETKDWTAEDYQKDAAFVQARGLTEGVDEVFVNGDSVIPGARSLDGVFKARLFGQAEG